MSNVLDLADQTIFRVERAAGVTNLMQCVWVYNRADRHRRSAPVPSPSSAGTVIPPHRTLTVAVRPPSLGLTQRSARTGDRRDASPARRIRRLAGRAGQHPTGCRARTRMAPRGAPLHRRRRRGELGRLPLPHRRRRAVRGRWQTRPPATTTQSTGPLPGHGGGGRRVREDARQTVRDIPAIGRAAVAAARFVRRNARRRRICHPATGPARRSRRTHHAPNGNDLRRRRRVGRPRRRHSGGPATRCSRHLRPASPSEWDESPQTARSP